MASNFAPVTAAPRPPPDGPRRKGRWHQRAFCWEALAPPPDQTPSRRPIVHHPPPPAHCCTLTFGTTKEYARWRAIQDTKPLPLRCSIAAFYAQSPAKAEHTHIHTHATTPTPTPTPTPTRDTKCVHLATLGTSCCKGKLSQPELQTYTQTYDMVVCKVKTFCKSTTPHSR